MSGLGIGEALIRARAARGRTLDDAERDTGITRRYLQALEDEQFDLLPAPVYVRGFLRSYCRYLGIDSAPLLAEVRRHRLDALNIQPRWSATMSGLGIGEALIRARAARGRTLDDAERDTGITRRCLQALEDERFDLFPAPVYRRSFLRSYCQYLGIDPAPLLAEVRRHRLDALDLA